jgi:hypothetical protein
MPAIPPLANSPSLIPTGQYNASIIASAMKPTKKGTGRYLELLLRISEGPYKGRVVVDRLNVENPNLVAVHIAYGQLANIRRALGVDFVQVSEDLHDKPLTIHVRSEMRRDTGAIVNVVKNYGKAVPLTCTGSDTEQTSVAGAPSASSSSDNGRHCVMTERKKTTRVSVADVVTHNHGP